jgi:nucleolin
VLRAASSASRSLLSTPRATRSLTTRTVVPIQYQLRPFAFQRRFLSDNTTRETEILESAEPVAEATEAVTEQSATEESNPVVPLGPESPSLATKPEGTNSLYIGNLFFEVTPEEIEQTFSAVGPVKSLKIIRDSRGLSKG